MHEWGFICICVHSCTVDIDHLMRNMFMPILELTDKDLCMAWKETSNSLVFSGPLPFLPLNANTYIHGV